jgi:hypothetical protein
MFLSIDEHHDKFTEVFAECKHVMVQQGRNQAPSVSGNADHVGGDVSKNVSDHLCWAQVVQNPV